MDKILHAVYPLICPVCTHVQWCVPSVYMRSGLNHGTISCLMCKEVLSIWLEGSIMKATVLDGEEKNGDTQVH